MSSSEDVSSGESSFESDSESSELENAQSPREHPTPTFKKLKAYTSPLYIGAQLSALELIDLLSSFENTYNISAAAMQAIFLILDAALPSQHTLPSYHIANAFKKQKATIETTSHLICTNGCEVFRKQTACGHCHQPVEDAVPFTGISLQSQLQTLLLRPDLVTFWPLRLTPHAGGNTGSLYDSLGWRQQVVNDADFASEPENIVLGFAGDSADAYNDRTNPLPFFPEMLVVYNLPRHIRYKTENMLMTGIIPPHTKQNGKYLKPKNMDGYFEVLVDELERGYDAGFSFTSIQQHVLTRRVKLLLQIGDYPGQCEISKQTSHAGELGIFLSEQARLSCEGQVSSLHYATIVFVACCRLHQVLDTWQKKIGTHVLRRLPQVSSAWRPAAKRPQVWPGHRQVASSLPS
jgi:hypothetical protein